MFLIRPPSARILALPVGLILIVSLIYYSSARVRSTAHKSFTPTPHHDAPEAPHDSTISPEHRKNAIVMAATMSDSVDWVTEELPQFEAAIYSVDNDPRRPLHTPVNKGNEAMAYLTYIIDNYHTLPNVSIFMHSHRGGFPQAWHVDAPGYSNVWSASHLNLETVRQKGFVNLRCNGDPGCNEPEIQPFRNPPDPTRSAELAYPEAWNYIMGPDVPLPREIATACCGQFAASREEIQKRPKEQWIKTRQWLIDTPLANAESGRVLEYMWHIFFNRDPIFCTDYDTCQCELYGHCSGGWVADST